MSKPLAEKYRPQRFKDVRGQDAAVKLLSRLAELRGGRPVLLSGAYGSGKTSLVRLFAPALNCNRLDDQEAPCGCGSCLREEHDYLVEYDVPARGGERDNV